MPKVVTQPITRAGCHVTGRIFGGRAGQQITVTLERPCTWQGTLVPMRFEATTDASGRFEMWLPPTAEMSAQDGGGVPRYLFLAEQVGSWLFAVPTVETWTLS